MALPEPILDDLRFQKDLVDEARRRIIRYSPDWTDYNLSDPGITLIELFAWMTELITYRLNLVPEKNYIRFLDLLGIQLLPAQSARTELTFRLATGLPITPDDNTEVKVLQDTAVATRSPSASSGDDAQEVIFTTDETLLITAPRIVQLRRNDPEDFNKNYLPRLGVEVMHAFNRQKPQAGDTFYIGFDEARSISGYILRLHFSTEETQGAGVRREDPPWVWECALGNGKWVEIEPSLRQGERETTGGLNNAEGDIVFSLPLDMQIEEVHGRRGYWLRCRIEQRRREQGMYRESPRIRGVQAFALGGAVRATNAIAVTDEGLGESDGEPGQIFHLQHTPALELREGETVEIEEARDGEMVWVPWQRVHDFSASSPHDYHFTLDGASGEIAFGPAVRQSDGSVKQYGRVPPATRKLRFTSYRHGGGVAGNVPRDRIQMLRSAIPFVDRVTNLIVASGGRDQESIDEAKLRAQRELRAQQRAVTAVDFETLTIAASRRVGRAHCLTGANTAMPPGMIEMLVIPSLTEYVPATEITRLQIDNELRKTINNHLDAYRLLTTTLFLREPAYIGVKVQADIVVNEFSDPDAVRDRVMDRLQQLLSPLAQGDASAITAVMDVSEWAGWPFGRKLYVSELYALIQGTPGVKHVREVRMGSVTMPMGRDTTPSNGSAPRVVDAQPGDARVIETPADGVLCSLRHIVNVVML
jgi:predicted phage baseplate assembly protein